MEWNAKWIKPNVDIGDIAPIFSKDFKVQKPVKSATLFITALGVYEATINGQRIGNFIMAPGWTMYYKRLQYQTYDVTQYLKQSNNISVTVGKGWYRSRMPWPYTKSIYQENLRKNPAGLLAQLEINYEDDSNEIIYSNETWKCSESPVRFSELYDGEIYDATFCPDFTNNVVCFSGPSETLIPQEGPDVLEQERLQVARTFTTPKGEFILDFGQEITGYIETSLCAQAGDILDISFAEVMDKEGNFYTENYRSAKASYHYTCRDGQQTYKPKLTFWGFRYIRINQFPGGIDQIKPNTFTAIVLHSDMERTGYLECSNPLLNKLFSNIIWGQKGNFLDVPTDCPQRDERMGWTGDAQVFIRTACLNYDVEKFFTKWLADLATNQHEDGYVGHVIPDLLEFSNACAAWGDAATICPWQLYLAYGNPQILKNQFESMKKWVNYIPSESETPFLWTGGIHNGDWLALDAPSGSYKGSSNDDFIASAFYAYSTSLVVKAGKALGIDVTDYEILYQKIVNAFKDRFHKYSTQTECVLAAYFHLTDDEQAAADQLAHMIIDCGMHLQTGFVGTPYLLHVLSTYGYADIAYSLLLREEYPSWLYSVKKGATTIWEHWDSIMEDGNFWSPDMNSFNHYAYGSVADWVYSVAAGINPIEEFPGYQKVRIAPIPDKRLDWLKATLKTRHGVISSEWKKAEDCWRYEITTPVDADITIDGNITTVSAGSYLFYGKM